MREVKSPEEKSNLTFAYYLLYCLEKCKLEQNQDVQYLRTYYNKCKKVNLKRDQDRYGLMRHSLLRTSKNSLEVHVFTKFKIS